jgi:hypothetical protein
MSIRTGSTSMKLEKSSSARVRLRKNQTAQIDVSGGRARVATKNRGKVDVKAGQRQSISGDGQAQDILKFEIALAAPDAGKRIFFAGGATDVGFSWKAQPGKAPYLFELSSDPEFENLVFETRTKDTAITAPDILEGVYHWRVRGEGNTVSMERRLTLIEDRAPIFYRPRSGQIVYVPEGEILRLAWTRVPGVGAYQLELARGENAAVRTRVERPFYLHRETLPEGHYCGKVRSDEPERGDSPWSQSRCFRLIHRPLPRAPELYQPKVEEVPVEKKKPKGSWLKRLFIGTAHAQAAPSRAIVLRWEAIPGIKAYIIEIAEDREFKNIVVKKRVPHNYYRWTLTHRTYYWRVRSVDADGREGENSRVKIIGAVVAGPKPLAPKPDASIGWGAAAPKIALKWVGSDLLARYNVTIAKDAAFTQDVTTHEVKGKPQLVYRPPEPGNFHWRVTGVDLNGRPTEPSEGRSFTVVIKAPDPIRPQQDEAYTWKEDQLKINLTWSKRPALKYEIQLARDPKFKKKAARIKSPKPSAVFQPETMGTLYWRVRCLKPKCPWSRPLSFSIAPATPALLSPPEGETTQFRGESASVELSWQAVPKATAYLVEVTTKSEPLRVEGTSVKLKDLAAGSYTWKVRAVVSPDIQSEASPPRTFELTREAPKPPPPKIVKKVVVKKPKVVKPPPEPTRMAIHVGPRVAFFYNLGEVQTARFGAEFGYRPPWWNRRLGIILSAGYYTATASASDQNGTSADSRLHAVPVGLVGVFYFPTGSLDPYLGGGMSLDVIRSSVSLPTHSDLGRTDLEIGFVAVAGAEMTLGPGAAFLEVRYALTTKSDGLIETDPGGLTAGAGYRIRLW